MMGMTPAAAQGATTFPTGVSQPLSTPMPMPQQAPHSFGAFGIGDEYDEMDEDEEDWNRFLGLSDLQPPTAAPAAPAAPMMQANPQ